MITGVILIVIGIAILFLLYKEIKKDGFGGEGITSMEFRMHFGFLISGVGFILIGVLFFLD